MTVKCVGAYNVEVLRITKVDTCGMPVYGPASTLVIDCFETLEVNADIEDGEEIAPVNANGRQCFFVPANKLDRGFEVVANFWKKYPNLFTALNPNWLQAIDELGNITGYQHIPEVSQNAGVAIEGWESVAGTEACTPGSEGAWNYFALPYVVNWARGDMEMGNQVDSEEWNGHTLAAERQVDAFDQFLLAKWLAEQRHVQQMHQIRLHFASAAAGDDADRGRSLRESGSMV